jgi:hypothetical protein
VKTAPTLAVAALVGACLAGCGPTREYKGPVVDAFQGRLVHQGKPVSFAPGAKVTLRVFHEMGTSFIIPLQPDGSFQIGWMPIGSYNATLMVRTGVSKQAPKVHNVPKFSIEPGKTQYEIDLGDKYKA